MKHSYKIIALFILIFAQSCQSEYTERMSKAVALKKKHIEISNILQISKSEQLKSELKDIEEEIQLHATISGNEEQFLKDLWRN